MQPLKIKILTLFKIMKMKTQLFWFASLLVPGYLSGEEGFTNVIEMVELGAGDDAPILWNMPGNIAAEGFDKGGAVPEEGALFILSTIQASPFQDWFLDQTAVGGFLPRAEIEIETHDTVSAIPSTRADQPIQVKVEVSGLFDPSSLAVLPGNVQQAAKEVRLQRFSQDYPAGENTLPGGEVSTAAHSELALVGNGDFPKNSGDLTFYTSLSPGEPDKARGEEHFVVRSLDDGGIEGSALEQARVQVWPVWYGSIQGLEDPALLPYSYSGSIAETPWRVDGEIPADEGFVLGENEIGYEDRPPEVSFLWNDLYPSCEVAIIVNDADIPYPWGGLLVGGTSRVLNEDANHDFNLKVKTWDGIFGGQGRYAVWMVTKTPGIGWEVGGNFTASGFQPGGWLIPIQRDRISIRGSIQSLK